MTHHDHPAGPRDAVAASGGDVVLAEVAGDPELAATLEGVRDELVTDLDEEVAAAHLAAIRAAAAGAAHTAPTAVAGIVGTQRPWVSRVRRVLGLTGAKLALTATATLAATGGFAATDSLPDPAQRVVADVADRVGLDLPSPDDPAPEDVGEVEPDGGAAADGTAGDEAPLVEVPPADDASPSPTPSPHGPSPSPTPAADDAADARDDAGPADAAGDAPADTASVAPRGPATDEPGRPDSTPPASTGPEDDTAPGADDDPSGAADAGATDGEAAGREG